MKANELMIGDWVMTANGIARVIMMGEHSPCYTTNTGEGEAAIFPHDLQSIPLTPEILEKNGFKNEGYFAKLDVCEYHILCDTKNVAVFHREHTIIDVPICYVHELQHALRLCGIEKEITIE